MADNGVDCSMSRSGDVWDNAAMESFFSSLKTERISRKVYRTRDAARADVFDYLERFKTTLWQRSKKPFKKHYASVAWHSLGAPAVQGHSDKWN